MDSRANRLEDHLLAAFERALEEERFDVADHVLRALEAAGGTEERCACEAPDQDEPVAAAYRCLAGRISAA